MAFYWVLFALISAGHLYLCFKENEPLRKVSKLFIVPSLMVILLLYQIDGKFDNYLVYIGLLFGYIGDIFLIITRKKIFFVLGTISFLIGHIIYVIASILRYYNTISIPYYVYIIIAILLVLFVVFIGRQLAKKLGLIGYLGATYFYILLLALAFSFYYGYYISVIGFILFIVSDTLISLTKFSIRFKHHQFYIMTTYILAQLMISLSFLLNL